MHFGRKRDRTIQLGERLFFTAYVLFLVFALLSISFYAQYIENIQNYVYALCIMVLLFKEALAKINMKELAAFIFCLFLTILLMISGSIHRILIPSFFFIISARDIKLRKVLKVSLCTSILVFFVIVASAYGGIIENYVSNTSYRGDRFYMGFLYVLYGPSLFLNITAMWIYVREKSISNWELLGLALINWLIYIQTNARLSFGLTILCIAGAVFLKYRSVTSNLRWRVDYLMVASYPICCALSFTMTLGYSSRTAWMRSLNEFLGNRLFYGLASIHKYGFSLLPNPSVQWVGHGLNALGEHSKGTYLFVDNIYLHIGQRYGLIFLVVFVSLLTFTCYRCAKKDDRRALFILFLLSLAGLIDANTMYLYFNSFLFVIGIALFSRKARLRTAPVSEMHRRKRRRRIRFTFGSSMAARIKNERKPRSPIREDAP